MTVRAKTTPASTSGSFAPDVKAEPSGLVLNRFAPSVFNPEAVNAELVVVFDSEDDLGQPDRGYLSGVQESFATEAAARGLFHCTICGNRLRYVSVFNSDLGMFVAGEDCAATVGIAQDLGDRVSRLRQISADGRSTVRQAHLRDQFLASHALIDRAFGLRDQSMFLQDMFDSLAQRGSLSPRQQAAVLRAADRVKRQMARDARWGQMPKMEVPEGQQVVTGEVISMRQERSSFGRRSQMVTKMMVLDDRGFKVWCTAPADLRMIPPDGSTFPVSGDRELEGSRVSFTATLSRSDRDSFFGFGSRPSKASVLAPYRVFVPQVGFLAPDVAEMRAEDLRNRLDSDPDGEFAALYREQLAAIEAG